MSSPVKQQEQYINNFKQKKIAQGKLWTTAKKQGGGKFGSSKMEDCHKKNIGIIPSVSPHSPVLRRLVPEGIPSEEFYLKGSRRTGEPQQALTVNY